jgi:hypothetical protein
MIFWVGSNLTQPNSMLSLMIFLLDLNWYFLHDLGLDFSQTQSIFFFPEINLIHFINNNEFNTRMTNIKNLGTSNKTRCFSQVMSNSISLSSYITDSTVFIYIYNILIILRHRSIIAPNSVIFLLGLKS